MRAGGREDREVALTESAKKALRRTESTELLERSPPDEEARRPRSFPEPAGFRGGRCCGWGSWLSKLRSKEQLAGLVSLWTRPPRSILPEFLKPKCWNVPDVLSPLGTDTSKLFLETAPVLIAIFQQSETIDHEGRASKTYYPKESVGIATGFLIAALHEAGLATLTHTPSPMGFLNEILKRPDSEKPFLLLVVGYPTLDCHVPVIAPRGVEEISSWH